MCVTVCCDLYSPVQGQPVGDCDFDRRLYCIDRELIQVRHEHMKNGDIDKTKEPFSVRKKPFWDITNVRKVTTSTLSRTTNPFCLVSGTHGEWGHR